MIVVIITISVLHKIFYIALYRTWDSMESRMLQWDAARKNLLWGGYD